jgi:serine/threonine protein kinase
VGLTPRPAADSAVRIGQVFLGKYKVESILGQGGMGVVVECTHLQLNERVAIKMLRPDVLVDPDAVERFMREAQAAVKLKSEYVARVSDVGSLENGTPYMVMEFLEGIDLGALIDERGCVPVPWAAELMLQTAEALSEAHSISIVHRDIKPANLFVTWRPDGTALIKVLDFGISKAPMGTDMHLTQTQSLLGTPAYMSPEQMRSARLVDARTDIWSLGSVMYELIEGRKPFEAESFSEMCVKVAVDPPQPMHNAPPELQQVILRCLAKSPEQRYASMADLARDLVPYCHDPHQASLLVERMQRMLRRSDGGGWDTQTGQRSVPNHVRDPKSQPIHAQPWHGTDGHVPVQNRFSTPLPIQGGVPLHAPHERSAPARAPSEWGPTQKPTKKGVIVVFSLLALVGVGVGLALGLGTGDEATGRDRIGEPIKPTDTKPTADTSPRPADTKTGDTTLVDGKPSNAADSKPAVTDVTPTTPTGTKAGDPAASDPKPGDTKTEVDQAIEMIGDTKKPGSERTVAKTGTAKTGTAKSGTAKTGTAKTNVKTTPKETPKEAPKEAPACNPFENPRGCGK